MTTVYEASQDIADNAVDQLTFDLKQDQISHVFSLGEFISEMTYNYLNTNLIYTRDIVRLWEDLGYPESEGELTTISGGIYNAVYESMICNERVYDDVTLTIHTWASDECHSRKIDTTDIEDDTEELVRALA